MALFQWPGLTGKSHLQMAFYGYVCFFKWHFMDIYGYLLLFVAFYGYLWNFMAIYGY